MPLPLNQAVSAWNMMNGEIDWSALPLLTELLAIDDIELFVDALCALRDFKITQQDG